MAFGLQGPRRLDAHPVSISVQPAAGDLELFNLVDQRNSSPCADSKDFKDSGFTTSGSGVGLNPKVFLEL